MKTNTLDNKVSGFVPFSGSAGFISGKRYLLWLCLFWGVVATLEFGQDYLSAVLNGNIFIAAESLSYKFFWLLFIPTSVAIDYLLHRINRFQRRRVLVITVITSVLVFTLVHLLVFSGILFGVSNLIHHQPVTLMSLLYEKLSTRLYIALVVYIMLPIAFVFLNRRRLQPELGNDSASKEYPATITVKNGKRSVIVDVTDICWIGSDGAYLDIHTKNQTHVVLDSLKHIIHRLPGNFRRIHRSTIVNMDCVAELKSRGNGDYDVFLKDGSEIRLSRNYTAEVQELLR